MKTRTLAIAAAVAIGLAGLGHAAAPLVTRSPSEHVMAAATQRLQLSPAQQAALAPLVERTLALRSQTRQQLDVLLDVGQAELSRPDADLAALAAEIERGTDARMFEARTLRTDFLAFYREQLNPDQQARVRERLVERLERLDMLRDHLFLMRHESLLPMD